MKKKYPEGSFFKLFRKRDRQESPSDKPQLSSAVKKSIDRHKDKERKVEKGKSRKRKRRRIKSLKKFEVKLEELMKNSQLDDDS